MSVDKIYYEKELKHIPEEINAIKEFLNSFYHETGVGFASIFPFYGIEEDDYLNQFSFVRYFLHNIQRKYLGVFYEMLKCSDYDMRTEIQFFSKLIGSSQKTWERKDFISYADSSPIIDGCYVSQDKVHIESEYGSIVFQSIFELLDEEDIVQFFNKYKLAENCHNVSWELMSYYDKVNLVTSLMKSGFKAEYYHTYLEKDGIVIDAASGIKSDIESYNGLYLPTEVSKVSKDDVDSEYEKATSNHQFDNSCIKPKALRIAINKEKERGM